MRKINYIVFHCTAGPQTQTVSDIQAYWRRPVKLGGMGWTNPGYHILIDPDGQKHRLQPLDKIANGVQGYNSDGVHCSYIGGVDKYGRPLDNRTVHQKEAMKEVLEEWHALFPSAAIRGHRDFSVDKNKNGIIEPGEWMKSCPSFEVKDWLEEIGFKSIAAQPMLRTTTRVNIREGEGTQFKIIRTLNKGELVKHLASGNHWEYVSTGLETGWVSADYLQRV